MKSENEPKMATVNDPNVANYDHSTHNKYC
jgi:hypothetical protein